MTIASALELVNDVGVRAIWGTETHDFSIAMAKITGAAKVLQFSGNSSLGSALTQESVAPGGRLHYAFQTEPPELQRSGSTAEGVMSLLAPALPQKPKLSVVFVANDATGQYLSSHYVKALEAKGQKVDLMKYPPDDDGLPAAADPRQGHAPGHGAFLVQWRRDADRFPAGGADQRRARAISCSASIPAIYAARKLVSAAPVTLSCVPMCWGAPPTPEAEGSISIAISRPAR